MVTITTGATLGTGDLAILPRDAAGNIVAPTNLTYSIFSVNASGGAELVTPPKLIPAAAPSGGYYVNMTIPVDWMGEYRLVWYLQQYVDSNEVSVFEEFQVVPVNPASGSFEAPSVLYSKNPAMNPKYAPAIMYVRELLSDTNPDRNYHFRPPTPGKVVANMTTRVGFIWQDSTILRFLDLTIAKLNTWNPMNLYSFSLDTVPLDWGKAAAVGAASLCLTGEAARWAAEEFSYSLNGVSLDINKAALYQSLSETYRQEFAEWAPLITANRPFSVGLRQQRWILG